MIAPVIPENEAARQADLDSLQMQHGCEDRYDRITRLVTQIFKVPHSTISMVDQNKQWFKSRVGVEMCSTDREISFCGHAILQDDTFIIPDALADERFRDNPLVTGNNKIRFYAGRSLKGPKGTNVGTLCLFDSKPREFSEQEEAVLVELAEMVEREFNLVNQVTLQKDLIDAQQEALELQEQINEELRRAAKYVENLLPAPAAGEISTSWHFTPSAQLGGDAFGYHWIDENHFALYGLDVAGHGVSSSLLSVSALNSIRSPELSSNDMRNPSAVLESLNRAFPMQEHDNKFFSLWYGVFHKESRQLRYACAGHPRPFMIEGCGLEGTIDINPLETGGVPIGLLPGTQYETHEAHLNPNTRLLLFSDGIFEVADENGLVGTYEEFHESLEELKVCQSGLIEAILCVQRQKAQGPFTDDVSLVEVRFGTVQ